MIKKFNLAIILLISLFLGVNSVNAASASISVSSNTKTVIVGNTVKVTVTVSSPFSSGKSGLGSWEYCISYDSSVLKLTSSTADANSCVKAGVVTSVGQKSSSETFTFKALKSGSSKVTVKSYAVYDYYSESQISTSPGSVTIKTMTQAELEATYSSNANLKSIKVGNYELNPKFDKGVYEYSVDVENNVEKVNVTASKEDSTASISGTGEIELLEGNNKVEIVVTAQKGNRLVYVVNIYRKELDPISVDINSKEYTIIRKADNLPEYNTFQTTTVNYNGTEIPALYSDITKYTLIGLKDNDGNVYTYIYDNGVGDRYEEVKSEALIIYPLDLKENDDFSHYQIYEINFNGYLMNGYKLDKSSRIAIIYARNIETGQSGYYEYDTESHTLQPYSDEVEEYYQAQLKKYKYVIYAFAGLSIFLLFLLIFIKPRNKKIKTVEIISEEAKEEIKAEPKKKNSKKKQKEDDSIVKVKEIDL